MPDIGYLRAFLIGDPPWSFSGSPPIGFDSMLISFDTFSRGFIKTGSSASSSSSDMSSPLGKALVNGDFLVKALSTFLSFADWRRLAEHT